MGFQVAGDLTPAENIPGVIGCLRTAANAFMGMLVILTSGRSERIFVLVVILEEFSAMLSVRSLNLSLTLGMVLLAPTSADELSGAQRDFFENRIRPALARYCFECHSAESEEVGGKLLLDTKHGLLKGGESGRIVMKGAPDDSLLIQALRWDGTEMPPEEKLPPSVLHDFEQWVLMGAPDPRIDEPSDGEQPAETAAMQHWAFQPIQNPIPPQATSDWHLDPIDQFVVAKLQEAGLTPANDAPAQTIVRRLFYDLIGLPPSKEQLDHWSARLAPGNSSTTLPDRDALTELVDELLASPHFGERWGRYWLDVARYGESNGNDGLSRNPTFPHAWRYRDYVIRAFNRDTPYNRFLTEQIAGDLLPADSDEQSDWNRIATGFLALGSKPAKAMNVNFDMDVVADQIGVVSSGVMGLSVGCARCHDHKHDPIPTRDYYALAGIFTSTTTMWGLAANENLTAPATPLHELKVLKRPDRALPDLGAGAPDFAADYSTTIQSLHPVIYAHLDAPHPDLAPEEGAQMAPGTFATMGKGRIRGKVQKPIDSYSVSLWFRNDLKSDSVILTAYLFSFANRAKLEGAGDHYGISGTYKGADPGHLFLFPGAKQTPSVTGASVIKEHTWNHLVMVRDKQRVRVQLNGIEQLEIDADVPPSFKEVREFTLGSRSDGMFSLNGNMAEFAFFDRALTRAEAKLLHTASGQPAKSGPVQPAPISPTPDNLAMGVRDAAKPGDCKININGESQKTGTSVPRGFLSAWTEPVPPIRIPPDESLRPLFESSLEATTRTGKPAWNWKDGILTGTSKPTERGFLVTKEEFRDFELQCEFELKGKGRFNSGISFRVSGSPDASPHFNLGDAAVDEPFGIFFKEWKLRAEPEDDINLTEWNQLKLRVVGDQITGWINGKQVVEYTLEQKGLPAGPIAFQSTAGKDEQGTIRFRNLQVQRLNQSERPWSPIKDPESSGRVELAAWLTGPEHPLTARVMVNRVWHHLMGQPIVSTPDDFGIYGARPTHPELLDHLATRFRAGGWSIKRLIRGIVLTRTYGLDSNCSPEIRSVDPNNNWLARHNRRRLDAEAIRDSVLRASGELNTEPGIGSDVQFLDIQVNQVGDTIHKPSNHRSIYLCMLRNSPPPDLAAFDLPDALEVKGRRDVTLRPTQSLYLLNSEFLVNQAEILATRLIDETDNDERERVIRAYERVLVRTPSEDEINRSLAFVRAIEADLAVDASDRKHQSWSSLCQALLLTSEFRFVD